MSTMVPESDVDTLTERIAVVVTERRPDSRAQQWVVALASRVGWRRASHLVLARMRGVG